MSADEVNAFLQEITGIACSAKDFRTWGATRTVTEFLLATTPHEDADADDARAKTLREAICFTAETLGNTTRICRDYYLHPAVIHAYEEGRFWPEFERFKAAKSAREGFAESEAFVLWLAK